MVKDQTDEPKNDQAEAEPASLEDIGQLTTAETELLTAGEPEPEPTLRQLIFSKNCLIIFFISAVIGALIAGGILVSQRALEKRSSSPPTVPTPTPVVTLAAPTPTTAPEPAVNLADYRLQALNGSGGKGVAAAVRDLLEEAGFTDVKIGNAGIYDYVDTEVSLKETVPDEVFEAISAALEDYQVVRTEEILAADEAFDVVIIVGQLQTAD